MPDISLYGDDKMSASERREFMAWYDEQKERVNRRVLEDYCQDDVTMLREASTISRRDFIDIGNIEVFLEAFTIASVCNKVLRKKLLKPDTIGLIPSRGYSCNQNYSNALMWLLHTEQIDGRRISHARNGREYRLPELPIFSVDGYCPETRTVNEFLGAISTVVKVGPLGIYPHWAVTLCQRYEHTMNESNRLRAQATMSRLNGKASLTNQRLSKRKQNCSRIPSRNT